MTRILFFISIVLSFSCTAQELRKIKIKPSSTNFVRITGRVKNNKDSVGIYWPGSRILIRFKGTGLSARLKDQHGKNYFNIILDGDSLHYIKLDSGKHDYTLVSSLDEKQHSVELIKRTEWDLGNTWFYGFEVTGAPLPLPPKNKRVIEFFGNSITAGYAIENYTGGDSPDSIFTNNYYTYAALTARHYKADLYCTVKSGIGIMISWFPLIMPEMYDRLDPADSLSKWNFRKVSPDIVVINLFQNDSWIIKLPNHPSFKKRFGSSPPDESKIIDAYYSFVKKIRSVYPKTSIICALGPMDATREGAPWPGYIRRAVEQMHDDKIYVHFFPFNHQTGHPRKEDNAKMAESLIDFIDKNIKW
jgi:hypothetical protein